MPGLLIAVLLIASLLLVHFSMRTQPLQKAQPLNVDRGLPLPEVAQASTVFSLTALFGAYLGIYLVLGLPALTGLATGTIVGLALLRSWIDQHGAKTFEAFLAGVLKGPKGNATVVAIAISGVQCAYATSELLILREIAKVTLGLNPDQATLVSISLAIIGYFYVLFGGYMAVFRTDVLQFVLVAVMAIIVSAVSFHLGVWTGWTAKLVPRVGYWKLPLAGSTTLLYAYHFAIGVVMGTGLVVASPDAWKRVFVVTKMRRRSRLRFLVLSFAAGAPFLILVPLATTVPSVPDGQINVNQLFAGFLTSNTLFVAAALGLLGSFLSAFNSALLVGVHVGLMMRRKLAHVDLEMPRFHWLMIAGLFFIFFLFMALVSSRNPYLLANLLLGAYALIAGAELGTRSNMSRLPENSLLWIFVLGAVGWFLYFLEKGGIPNVPMTYQVNTVPGGALLCLTTAVFCRILARGASRNV